MTRGCINCETTLINKLESEVENKIPLWYKKEGNYSLLPKMLNCNPKFNPHKTELKEHKPEITEMEVKIPTETKKETWIFYWAALSNSDFKKIESQEVAYGNETNYGLIRADKEGKATLVLNCPQPYKVNNITYPRHVHYTILTKDDVWSDEIKTLVVNCHLTKEQFKKYLNSKSHMVINALPKESHNEKSIEDTLNLPVDELNNKNRKEKIDNFIDDNINKYSELNELIVNNKLEKENIPIITYCAHKDCNASERLVTHLINSGYSNIIEYPGGIKEWYNQIDKDDNESDDEIKGDDEEDNKYNLGNKYETVIFNGIHYKHQLDDLNYIFDNDDNKVGELINNEIE